MAASRYTRIGDPVGAGSFGRVWLAVNEDPSATIAYHTSRYDVV
jgi:hypothetical protein